MDVSSKETIGTNNPVNDLYEEETYDLVEEIMDMMDKIEENDTDAYCWQEVVEHLKKARDCIARYALSEGVEHLDESFKVGKNKLTDGSVVTLSKDDVSVLKAAIASTADKKSLLTNIKK